MSSLRHCNAWMCYNNNSHHFEGPILMVSLNFAQNWSCHSFLKILLQLQAKKGQKYMSKLRKTERRQLTLCWNSRDSLPNSFSVKWLTSHTQSKLIEHLSIVKLRCSSETKVKTTSVRSMWLFFPLILPAIRAECMCFENVVSTRFPFFL